MQEVWELLRDPARSPEWSEDVVAVTGAPTNVEKGAELELGVQPIERKRGLAIRAMTALHTKGFLGRQVETLLDGLRRAVSRERASAT